MTVLRFTDLCARRTGDRGVESAVYARNEANRRRVAVDNSPEILVNAGP